MGLHWADHSVEVNAPIDACFATITDYDGMEDWLSAVLGTEILETDPDTGLADLVKLDVDGKVRTINYTLRYDYERPTRVGWDFVEGHGVKRIEGEWTFEDRGATTLATYKLGVDPGGGVPGPIAKRMNRQVIKRSVEDLRDEVERRARAGADDRAEAEAAIQHPPAFPPGDDSGADAYPHSGEPTAVDPAPRQPTAARAASDEEESPLDQLSDAALEAAEAGAKLVRVSVGVAMITGAKLLRRGRDLLP